MLPHATEVEGARAAQCAAMVGRPHRGSQPKLDAVGHGNGLSLVGEGLHGDHRPEDLDAPCTCKGVCYYWIKRCVLGGVCCY